MSFIPGMMPALVGFGDPTLLTPANTMVLRAYPLSGDPGDAGTETDATGNQAIYEWFHPRGEYSYVAAQISDHAGPAGFRDLPSMCPIEFDFNLSLFGRGQHLAVWTCRRDWRSDVHPSEVDLIEAAIDFDDPTEITYYTASHRPGGGGTAISNAIIPQAERINKWHRVLLDFEGDDLVWRINGTQVRRESNTKSLWTDVLMCFIVSWEIDGTWAGAPLSQSPAGQPEDPTDGTPWPCEFIIHNLTFDGVPVSLAQQEVINVDDYRQALAATSGTGPPNILRQWVAGYPFGHLDDHGLFDKPYEDSDFGEAPYGTPSQHFLRNLGNQDLGTSTDNRWQGNPDGPAGMTGAPVDEMLVAAGWTDPFIVRSFHGKPALIFDGVNDYVSIPIFGNTSNMTVVVDIDVGELSQDGTLFHGGDQRLSAFVKTVAGEGFEALEYTADWASRFTALGGDVPEGSCRIILTRSSSLLNIYNNGSLEVTAAVTGGIGGGGSFGATIGSTNFSGIKEGFFAGAMSQFRVYDRILTAGEIANLSTASATGLLRWYKFDEGYGTTLVNHGSDSNANGTIVGATWSVLSAHRVGAIGFSPLSLFAAGEEGAWFDPSDLSTLFQDSAGTTPVTEPGQPVGLMLDKSGNGNHASQAVSAARPILEQTAGGLWYISGDGVDDWMSTAAVDFTGTDKMTAVIGVERVSNDTYHFVLELASPRNANGTFALTSGINLPGAAVSRQTWGIEGRSTARVAAGTVDSFVAPITSVLTGEYDLALAAGLDFMKLSVDGVVVSTVATAADAGTPVNFRNASLSLFKDTVNNGFFPGKFFGGVIIGALLSPAQKAAVQQHMAYRAGVSL